MKIDENKVLVSIDKENDIDENGLCVIPFGVKEIGGYVFNDCKELKSVIIPKSLAVIKSRAFSGCANLKSVSVPNSVNIIGGYAFAGCKNLESVSFEDNCKIQGIAAGAFATCCALKTLKLPSELREINYETFAYSGLEHIEIPKTVASIGWDAFKSCTNLKYIDIPEGVKEIDVHAFADCDNLTEVRLPNSLETISGNAFSKCYNLQIIRTNKPALVASSALDSCATFIPFNTASDKENYKGGDTHDNR